MNIREATKEDVPKILPVWRELMEFHVQRDACYTTCDGAEEAFSSYVCENIEKDDAMVLVAQDDEKIVGYCQCLVAANPPVYAIKKYGNLADTAVLEQYRRNGIGKQMVEQAMEWFKAKGLERIQVRMAVTNEVSTRFWRKMGFEAFAETLSQSIDLPEQT